MFSPLVLGELTTLRVGDEGLTDAVGTIDQNLLGETEAGSLDVGELNPEIVVLETYTFSGVEKHSEWVRNYNLVFGYSKRCFIFSVSQFASTPKTMHK